MSQQFLLHYHCSNNGDGSAGVHFHSTEAEAEVADEAQDEGFAESSVASVTLKILDGKIVRRELEWDAETRRHNTVWKPLEEVPSEIPDLPADLIAAEEAVE